MLGKCCQLLAWLSGQSGEKIRPLRKKICPLLNLTFWRYLAWELIFKEFGPFSTPFCTKLGQIRPQLCPAAYAATTKAQLPRYTGHKIRIKLDFHSGLRSIQCQKTLPILTVYCKNFRKTNKLEQKALRKIHVSFTYRFPLCAGKEKGK